MNILCISFEQAAQTSNLPHNHKFLSGIMYSTLLRQTCPLWYQIWTKCVSLSAALQIIASVQHLLSYMYNAWGSKPVTQFRFDADNMRLSGTLTHFWTGDGCSGPWGRSWSLVRWRCHSSSFGTEASGAEEETAAHMLFRIRIYNLHPTTNFSHLQSMSWIGVASQTETVNSCLGGPFSRDHKFKQFLYTNNKGSEIPSFAFQNQNERHYFETFFQSGLFLL